MGAPLRIHQIHKSPDMVEQLTIRQKGQNFHSCRIGTRTIRQSSINVVRFAPASSAAVAQLAIDSHRKYTTLRSCLYFVYFTRNIPVEPGKIRNFLFAILFKEHIFRTDKVCSFCRFDLPLDLALAIIMVQLGIGQLLGIHNHL